jgi:squalene-hopene/tetraprenyl-beta-curcumene cyclase
LRLRVFAVKISGEKVMVNEALKNARERLLAELLPEGRWEGELSSSALATAVAAFALKSAGNVELAERGFDWLETHRNADGGWGDSPESQSNFTTTLLCRCVLDEEIGSPQEVARTILDHYGDDRTFSVPILTMCMLTGKLGDDWSRVPQLPFELAAVPPRFYKFIRLPVVSYALPALIAIGLVRHVQHPGAFSFMRRRLIPRVLNILQKIQPKSGGFLEAAPLTGFVAMSLIGAGYEKHPVTQSCLRFLENTVRADGSWAIDVNLSTWVTSLATNALSDVLSEDQKNGIRNHLVQTQWKTVHPFTNSEPGGWGWTCESGAVPDADDTAAALIALAQLGCEPAVAERGIHWLLNLQNRDGGFPTFCKGWGRLPFDRSCPDLTAHAIRAFNAWRGRVDSTLWKKMERSMKRAVRYLEKQQCPDGSWLPLWFGNQANPNHENPIYGTVRVLEAIQDLDHPMVARGFQWLETLDLEGLCLEELALAVGMTGRGAVRLIEKTAGGTQFSASPIGLYFASLWYSERLYPLIFTVEALRKQQQGAV